MSISVLMVGYGPATLTPQVCADDVTDALNDYRLAKLRELLHGNHRYVFTLIQKFQTPEVLCDRSDVAPCRGSHSELRHEICAPNARS
jgi:hypothetical protein